MKKLVSLFLFVLLTFCFMSCSSNSNPSYKQITTTQLQSVVNGIGVDTFTSSWKGTLNITKTNGDIVTEFSYVVTGMDVSKINSSAILEGLFKLKFSDFSLFDNITYCQAVDLTLALEDIICLLDNSEGLTISEAESITIDIICHGKTKVYNGWYINADISESTNTITIFCKV